MAYEHKFLDLKGAVHLYNMIYESINAGFVTGGDNHDYTVTVPGVSELKEGMRVTVVPHVNSGTTAPTLDVNGLGKKYIRRRRSDSVGSNILLTSNTINLVRADKPITLMYSGGYWFIDSPAPSAADLMGRVDIANGGTGATTAEAALANLGAAPAYTCGAEDMTDGVSELETGKLYFVYEEAQA